MINRKTCICDLDQPMELALLHPLRILARHKADRDDMVSDCHGNEPVLIVVCLYHCNVFLFRDCSFQRGDNLPHDISLRIATISRSTHGCFFSVYRFRLGKGQYEEFHSRELRRSQLSPQRFE